MRITLRRNSLSNAPGNKGTTGSISSYPGETGDESWLNFLLRLALSLAGVWMLLQLLLEFGVFSLVSICSA